MARRAQWGNQHQVESEVEPGEIRARKQEGFGGTGNAAPLTRRECRGGRGDLCARLDLDDREHLAAPRENVDLAGGATPPALNDTPAAQPQMPEAEPFCGAPAALCALPAKPGGRPPRLHSFPSSSASARR